MHEQQVSYRAFLAEYLRPQWRLGLLVAGLLLTSIALQLANPQILRAFIDAAQRGGGMRELFVIGLLFLAVAVATQMVTVAETYAAENLGWLTTNQLRLDLTLHCLQLDPGFHAAHTPGELIERIDGDASTLANFFSRFVVVILGNGLLMIGVLVIVFLVDWRAGLIMTGFQTITVLGVIALRRIGIPHWTRARQASADLMGFIEEGLTGTEDIGSNGAVPYMMRELYGRSRALLRLDRKARTLGVTAGGFLEGMFFLGMALSLGIGAVLYRQGTISLGTVFLLFSYAQLLERPLDQISRQLQDFQAAAAGLHRVTTLRVQRSAIYKEGNGSLPSGPLEVTFRDVSFSYGEEPILKDISFTVAPEEVLGILGHTGSGKTTLSRLLFRLYDPQGGSVQLGGVDLRHAPLDEVRRRIGLVTQDIQLFHACVRDNLTFFDSTVPDDRILAVLDDLGLCPWLASLPHGLDSLLASGSSGLSAGEAQLLAFARVFLQTPDVVVLDEASSRLDPATEARIEHAVDRLLSGRTGLIIAHRLATIQRADSILILENGRIVEYGSRAALAADPHSRFAHLLQVGLEGVPA